LYARLFRGVRETAVERKQGTALLPCTRDQVSVVRVYVELGCKFEGEGQVDVEQANRDPLIDCDSRKSAEASA